MAVALRMLSRRPVSEGEVARRLAEKGFGEAEASETVSRLKELELLDDARLCEGLVRMCRESRRYGRAKTAALLRRRLVPAELAAAALRGAESGAEELSAAVEALRRKFREGVPPGREGAAKAYRFLAGRGFSPETCRTALRRAETEPDEGDP